MLLRMARLLRVEFEGALYHVTVRGVERRRLFRGDRDRERLIAKLAEGVERYELDVFLYCLMPNHVHLLLGTPRGNLGRFMGWWLTAYTTYYNLRHSRQGHLTQGRYGSKLVEGDRYLLTLSRYIHLNPVETKTMKRRPAAERISALGRYPWSSYRGYVYTGKQESFVRYEPLLSLVGEGRKRPRRAYQEFVIEGLDGAEEEWRGLQDASRIAIGSPEFIERIESQYGELAKNRSRQEDIALRRLGRTTDPKQVLQTAASAFGISVEQLRRRRRDVWDRAVAAHSLVRFSGLTQREAAAHLGMKSGAAVGAQLRKVNDARNSDQALKQTLSWIEHALQEEPA
jgi:REP element-mobilizing transposase RayT